MVRLVVSRLCERLEQGVDDHQAGLEVLAWAVSRLNADTAEGEPTASAAALPSPEPSRGLVERFIGASVPNHPVAPDKELPPDRTMPTGPLHAL